MNTTVSTEFFTFGIQRTYDASPARVYAALTNIDEKANWFVGPAGYVTLERTMDVRVGGKERVKGGWPDGSTSDFQATYHDVVPDARLVYSYEMYLGERRISISLATITLSPLDSGTQLDLNEHVVYLDGYPTPEDRKRGSTGIEDRERGSAALFDMLARYLAS